MRILVGLFGFDAAWNAVLDLEHEHPGMHDDYYIRNAIRILA